MLFIGRPPIAAESVHFLLGDKFCNPVGYSIRTVECQLTVHQCPVQLNEVDVLIAYETNVVTLGRELNIGFEGGVIAELTQ